MSDTAKNVKIKHHNITSDQIKAKKFQYYDYDRSEWNTETGIYGVDGHQIIEPGLTISFTRDLERIKDDKTKFKVTYSVHTGGTVWGPDKTSSTGDFTCHSESTYTVDIGS